MLNKVKIISLIIYFICVVIAFIFTVYSTQKVTDQYEILFKMNEASSHLLSQLVTTKFFRIIRLNLNQECPLMLKSKICKSKSCTVCRCEQKDIPQFWLKTDRVLSEYTRRDVWQHERDELQQWVWHVQDQQNDKGEYFDIYKNIESFTSYNGSSIWSLIYEQNCFLGRNRYNQMCKEERVLYNIISGLHTSISSHLCKYYRNISNIIEWADIQGQNIYHFNQTQYQKRVLNFPERIHNLLFLYQLIIRATRTMETYLLNNYTIESDNITEDLKATELLHKLNEIFNKYKLTPFQNQYQIFFHPENPKFKQYQYYIHNISRIMNCIECEKCKLFGKMQTYGLGTAIKIMLGYGLPYKRNEIVALYNALNKISISVKIYLQYRHLSQKTLEPQYNWFILKLTIGLGFLFLVFTTIVSKLNYSNKFHKKLKNTIHSSIKIQ